MKDQSVHKNQPDLKWEKMLPELGKDSPVYSIFARAPTDGRDDPLDRVSNRDSYSEAHT